MDPHFESDDERDDQREELDEQLNHELDEELDPTNDDDSDVSPKVVERPHLITVQRLRAAGALDVPPAWRKSLGAERKQRNLLLFGDDDMFPEDQQPTQGGPDENASADERQ